MWSRYKNNQFCLIFENVVLDYNSVVYRATIMCMYDAVKAKTRKGVSTLHFEKIRVFDDNTLPLYIYLPIVGGIL